MTADPVPASGAAQEQSSTPDLQTLPPRLGGFVSGGLSLFLTLSLVTTPPPIGQIIAPFGLIPVLRFIAGGQRGILAWGWVAFLQAVLIQVLAGTPAGDVLAALLPAYTLVIIVPSVTVELWLRFGWSEGRWVAITTLIATLICLLSVAVLTGADTVAEGPYDMLSYFPQDADELIRSFGLDHGAARDTAELMKLALTWLFSSFIVGYIIIVLFWVRPRLPLLGFPMPIRVFEEYRGEEWLPAAFAVTGLGVLLLEGNARWVAVNLLVAVLLLCFVHGLAIIRAHLARWIGRGWFVRWGIALLCLQIPLAVLVSALGLADSFFQLRPQTSENGRKP